MISYFNISGGPTIEGTRVTLPSNLYQVVDDEDIPTGAIEPYPEFNANEEFTLGAVTPAPDHCFIVNNDPASIKLDTRSEPLNKLISLYHPDSKIHFEALSTEPAFQFYAGKKINGRKRHILVDTLGLLLVVVIHTANIQDRDGLALVCRRLRRRFPWLRLIFADGGYQGETAACAAAQERLRLQIVKREPGTRGFAVLPKRWLVERTFAWLGRNRRLAKDFEATLASAATMVHLASIQLLARRLARA